ncbi:MAG TPA: hypothetical protein VF260_05650, partial [Bacilli bacterium]
MSAFIPDIYVKNAGLLARFFFAGDIGYAIERASLSRLFTICGDRAYSRHRSYAKGYVPMCEVIFLPP